MEWLAGASQEYTPIAVILISVESQVVPADV